MIYNRIRKRNRFEITSSRLPILFSVVILTLSWNSGNFFLSALVLNHRRGSLLVSSSLSERNFITAKNKKSAFASSSGLLDDVICKYNEDVADYIPSSVEKQQKQKRQIQQRNVFIDSSRSLAVLPLHSSLSTSSSSCRQPPWLTLFEEEEVESSSHATVTIAAAAESSRRRIREELERLEHSLLSFKGAHVFSKTDVADIIRAILWCGSDGENNNISKIVGSAIFCQLMLRLEDEKSSTNTSTNEHKFNDNYVIRRKTSKNDNDKNRNFTVNKDILLASILHFSECFNARYDGVYEEVQQTSSTVISSDGEVIDKSFHTLPILFQSSQITSSSLSQGKVINNSFENIFTIFTADSLHLAKAASRLKRYEVLLSFVLSYNNNDDSNDYGRRRRRPVTKEEYSDIRNLMVSLTDDWRALAIRCVASLFRLEGALKNSNVSSLRDQNPEVILAAKDSLRMYATLSQQLGLHRLRSQIEAKAFRILYPRQYTAASILFQEHGSAMEDISEHLSRQLKQLLHDDHSLMYELENLQVLSRVKEPFSFWKKLLKQKSRSNSLTVKSVAENDIRGTNQSRSQLQSKQSSTTELSIMDVNDGVALRVILKARKLDEVESDGTTRARERMLCYYIHHLLRSQWPETETARVKDYIQYPKKNGYQSLHHTSKFTRNNQDFFFEVQIRSEEMDRLAEFGVAAHSMYKADSNYPHQNLLSSEPAESSSMIIDSSSLVVSPTEQPMHDSLLNAGDNDCASSGSYICALEKTRQNLVRSHVYVFLAAGTSVSTETFQLLTLSAGSTLMDVVDNFRRLKDFPFNEQEVQVWCNGKIALFEENITNGDMIVIQPLIQSAKDFSSVNKSSSNLLLISGMKT